jgi:hypothetical protein
MVIEAGSFASRHPDFRKNPRLALLIPSAAVTPDSLPHFCRVLSMSARKKTYLWDMPSLTKFRGFCQPFE